MSLLGSRGVAMDVTHPWWPFRLPRKVSCSAILKCIDQRGLTEKEDELVTIARFVSIASSCYGGFSRA